MIPGSAWRTRSSSPRKRRPGRWLGLRLLGGLALVGLTLAGLGCTRTVGEVRYSRDGTQYGVTRGLFRTRWWNYYERGVSFLDGKFYEEAIRDLRSAIELRAEDQRRARTYGLHFVDYFPHRELGIALLATGKVPTAIQELEASLQQEASAKAKHYLNEARKELLARTGNDREAPRVAITSVKDGATTNQFVIDVRGEVTDDTWVKWVRINGRKQFIELAEPRKEFTRKVALKPGANRIEVAAGDLLDKQGEQTITVILDREGPLFSLRSPEDLAVVEEPRVRFAGRFSDATGVAEVKINGTSVRITPGSHVDVDEVLNLKPGPNVLTFEARDRPGNVTTGQLSVSYERRAEGGRWKKAQAPIAPLPWSSAAGSGRPRMELRLAGLEVLSDAARPVLSLARSTPAVPLLPIADAPDTQPPSISIKGLKNTENAVEVYADALFIDGKVKDPGGVASLRINEETVGDAQGKTIFFNHLVQLKEGENGLTIVAADAAGNEARRTLKVTRKVPSVQKVGSRFTLAILPFQVKGEPDVAQTVPELFQQKLLEQERFNLVARESEAFEAALRELKLSQTSLVDKSAAVKVGRIVQAEGIVNGSVREKQDSLEVFVQLIDTETTKILAIHDVFGTEKSLDNLEFLMAGLAFKLRQSFPLLEGLVVKVDNDEVMLDLGAEHRARPEMRFILYREGAGIKHPLTGKLMAGEPQELGVIRVTKVLKDSLVGKLIRRAGETQIKQLDKAIAE